MSRKSEIQRRVERMKAGDWSASNLDRIALYLRMRSYGSLVKELGDFVSHSDERDQGTSWTFTNDVMAGLTRIRAEAQGALTLPLLKRHWKATSRLAKQSQIKKATGFSPRRMRRVYQGAADKIVGLEQKKDGVALKVSSPITRDEVGVLEFLGSVAIVEEAFGAKKLIEDWALTIEKNGLSNSDEIRDLPGIYQRLPVYAAARMHGVQIASDDGIRTYLALCASDEGTLCVGALKDMDPDMTDPRSFLIHLFETNVHISDCVDANLLPLLKTADGAYAVEINEDGKVCLV